MRHPIACWKKSIPANLHPLMKTFFKIADESERTAYSIAEDAGVASQIMRLWYKNQKPRIDNLDACLNVLGYELVIRKIEPTSNEKGV